VNSIAPGRFDTDRVRTLDGRRAEAAGITIEEQRERKVEAEAIAAKLDQALKRLEAAL